jgi:hypothetical protein
MFSKILIKRLSVPLVNPDPAALATEFTENTEKKVYQK